jgi:hypothetical protein
MTHNRFNNCRKKSAIMSRVGSFFIALDAILTALAVCCAMRLCWDPNLMKGRPLILAGLLACMLVVKGFNYVGREDACPPISDRQVKEDFVIYQLQDIMANMEKYICKMIYNLAAIIIDETFSFLSKIDIGIIVLLFGSAMLSIFFQGIPKIGNLIVYIWRNIIAFGYEALVINAKQIVTAMKVNWLVLLVLIFGPVVVILTFACFWELVFVILFHGLAHLFQYAFAKLRARNGQESSNDAAETSDPLPSQPSPISQPQAQDSGDVKASLDGRDFTCLPAAAKPSRPASSDVRGICLDCKPGDQGSHQDTRPDTAGGPGPNPSARRGSEGCLSRTCSEVSRGGRRSLDELLLARRALHLERMGGGSGRALEGEPAGTGKTGPSPGCGGLVLPDDAGTGPSDEGSSTLTAPRVGSVLGNRAAADAAAAALDGGACPPRHRWRGGTDSPASQFSSSVRSQFSSSFRSRAGSTCSGAADGRLGSVFRRRPSLTCSSSAGSPTSHRSPTRRRDSESGASQRSARNDDGGGPAGLDGLKPGPQGPVVDGPDPLPSPFYGTGRTRPGPGVEPDSRGRDASGRRTGGKQPGEAREGPAAPARPLPSGPPGSSESLPESELPAAAGPASCPAAPEADPKAAAEAAAGWPDSDLDPEQWATRELTERDMIRLKIAAAARAARPVARAYT